LKIKNHQKQEEEEEPAGEKDKLSEHEAEELLDKVEVDLGSMLGLVDVEIIDGLVQSHTRRRAVQSQYG
jgi:hypothetical protein